ncbi:MAG: DedA family protein [Bdellovibrionaceae bacterium]|nr:DedA family protein [Pseudobdellovibrionaceae bacterium]
MISQFFHFLLQAWELLTHFHFYLSDWTAQLGPWMYLLLFLIIFAETGLVVTPFLPGDSLLFAIGALCALPTSHLSYELLLILLIIAALLGDSVNYWIGETLSAKLFKNLNAKILNPQHLARTEDFYKKYGGKTIILARFVPIVRTYAPFVAGLSHMHYKRFMIFNAVGGITWVGLFLTLGYFFGNIPAVQKNFTYLIFLIILISILPMGIEYWRHRRTKKKIK